MSQIHLRLDLYQVSDHAQKVMRDLGITYQICVPQSLYDCWWFFNCENVPEQLPDFLEVLAVDPVDCIGHGLSKSDVDALRLGKADSEDPVVLGHGDLAQKFKAGQIVPKRLRMCFCSDPKGRHAMIFGAEVSVIGRTIYISGHDGSAFLLSGKGRRMNNGTHKKVTWIIRDVHIVSNLESRAAGFTFTT